MVRKPVAGQRVRLYKAIASDGPRHLSQPELRPAARGWAASRQGLRQQRGAAGLFVRGETPIWLQPGNRPTRGLRPSIVRATGTAQGGGRNHAGAPWTIHAARGAGRGCCHGGARGERRHRHGGCRQGQQHEGRQGDGTRTTAPQPSVQARCGSRGTARPSPAKEPGVQG
jgi:hypothetical protein